jgi:hypothetical protein
MCSDHELLREWPGETRIRVSRLPADDIVYESGYDMGASHSRTRLLKKRKTTRKVAQLAERRLNDAAAATPATKATPAKKK